MIGDIGYQTLLKLNRPSNALRRAFGHDHWSLSAYVKSRVKNAVSFISQFENAVSRYAQMYDVDGIVCGHIHTPVIKRIRGVAYYNCGDWVESSTLLVEDHAGHIELLRWREVNALAGGMKRAFSKKIVGRDACRLGIAPRFRLVSTTARYPETTRGIAPYNSD